MPNIYYWRGAVGDATFLDEHRDSIFKLINKTYAHGDLEVLTGHRDVYSYRVNRTGRLLFTTFHVEGQAHLLLLEYLPTHDYQKSRFLRSGVLQQYLHKHEEDLVAAAHTFIPVDEAPDCLLGLDAQAGPTVALDYYHQQFIQLSDIQLGALSITLPAVVGGAAGSGKSCVAMLLLSNYVNTCRDWDATIAHKILYISESPSLVRLMETAWRGLPLAQDMPEHISVQFKTYNELLAERPECNGKTFVKKDDFEAWFSRYLRMVRTTSASSAPDLHALTSETVYQEFRICAAYDQETYYQLGARQSLITAELRESLYTAYLAYQKDLGKNNASTPPFMS